MIHIFVPICLFLSSVGISFTIISLCIYPKTARPENSKILSELEKYERKYILRSRFGDKKSFSESESDDNCENEYDFSFDNSVSFEDETPVGKVIMTYNPDLQQFEYYCDRHISNRLLEVVCRGFVQKYKCYDIYVDYKEEAKKRNLVVEKFLEKQQELQQKEMQEPKPTSVFAKLKSYNTVKTEKSTKLEDIAIKTKFNKFKNRGKLSDFNIDKNQEAIQENLSYIEFLKNKRA